MIFRSYILLYLIKTAIIVFFAGILIGCGVQKSRSDMSAQNESAKPESSDATSDAKAALSENKLAGTEWRLVEIQSANDTQGTTKPDNPSLYTMSLNADGSVIMHLNCNYAKGSWLSSAGSGASSGSFEFSALAATRAQCPPPSVDDTIVRQALYIRSYVLKDGRLYLSLMADGGIQEWEPLDSE